MIRLTPLIALLAVAACDTPPPTGAAIPAGTDLAGTSWRIESIAGVKVSGTAPATMAFDAATVSGSFGCNRFTGQYAVTGNLLTVSPVVVTRMACPGEAVRQEQTGLRQLALPMQVVPNGPNTLVLSGREGQSFVLAR
jgi:heat shock protein HslJ